MYEVVFLPHTGVREQSQALTHTHTHPHTHPHTHERTGIWTLRLETDGEEIGLLAEN